MQSQEPMAVKAPPAYLRAQIPPQAAQCLPKHSGIQQVANGPLRAITAAPSQCVPKQYSFGDPWSGEETYCGPWQ